MSAILDAALAGNHQLALAELEGAFGEAFGGSVTLGRHRATGHLRVSLQPDNMGRRNLSAPSPTV